MDWSTIGEALWSLARGVAIGCIAASLLGISITLISILAVLREIAAEYKKLRVRQEAGRDNSWRLG